VQGAPLVTGATGFAGSHLVDRLAAAGPVHALARPGGQPPAARPGVRWREVDLLDRDAVRRALEATRPSVIYHCAGFAHVQDAWKVPAQALRVNVIGTHNVLESCRDLALPCRVCITGSAQVYAPRVETITEDDRLAPDNPYGIAAQQIADIETGRAEPVLRVGNLDSRRDITDVRDTVRAYQRLGESGVPLRPYNVCSGRAYSMREILDILLSLARVRVRIEVDPSRLRPSDNPVILGSHARLTADTGWRPEIPIERTLSDLLDFWRARQES
jgi:GDP-4-dehydro-6-deoxy-D-mannose reductase